MSDDLTPEERKAVEFVRRRSSPFGDTEVAQAVARMRAWAAANGQADTQGLMDDEWEALARAALDLPQPEPQGDDA